MQLWKSLFSTGKGKKLGRSDRSLTQSNAHDHNRVPRFHTYNLVVGGRVSQCVLDRFILGWCFHEPTLGNVHHQNFTDDDGSQVYLEFLPLPTDRLSSTTSMALIWLQATHGFAIVFCIRQRESFDKLVDDFKFFLQLKEKNNVPLILVGSEPGYCESGSENARQVTAEEAEKFAQVLCGRYFEIGAEEGIIKGDYTPFRHLVREIQKKPPSESVS